MTPRSPRPRVAAEPRRTGLRVAVLVLGVLVAGVGVALALTPTGSGAYAVISEQGAVYSPISPFWLTWSRPVGLALLALGAGTTGAAIAAVVRSRS